MTTEAPENVISTRVKSRKHGVVAYAKNPFWQPTEVKVGTRKVTIAGGFVASTGTGESLQHAGIHRVEWVDEDQFLKIYTKNINVFFDLTAASQKVLRGLLRELQKHPNAEGIWFPWFTAEDCCTALGLAVSRTSFQRAMKEMLTKGFLAESENANFYWINPHLFFNGDRMVFINEYRRQEKRPQGLESPQ